ncbi:hypothetical protein FACS1894186_6890 [Alphaproteobacteria bacterium]|nr:hypothetical protein FACS1894186_6890 [Alphaproteobacteria bacterium]
MAAPVAAIVEDDALSRRLYRDLLETLGVAVAEYAGAWDESAIVAWVREVEPSLLVIDAHLAGASGVRVLGELAGRFPALLSTADASAPSGGAALVPKPLAVQDFLAAAKALLHSSS